MNAVTIQLFGGFRVLLNGRELPLAPSVKESLALLVVAAGHRVTAKGMWRVLYEYLGIKYSSTFYTYRINDLKAELEHFGVSGLLLCSGKGIRSCRLNQDAVYCDYYQMLDTERPFGEAKDFLSEYEWAAGFYQKDWSALHDYCSSLKL